MPAFRAATTALVLIDLQNGIVGMPFAPRTGADVVEAGRRLAERFRAAAATARQAYEHGYRLVIAGDATTSRAAEVHAFAVSSIFPLIARVTTVDEIALEGRSAAA